MGGTISKIDDNCWYIDYTTGLPDTFITFKTATGNELIQGEYYTLLFNVSGLTENRNVTFDFPRYDLNTTKLKNGINKIKFNQWTLREFNRYDFDDHGKDSTQQFYLSDFILYKNYGDEYLQSEMPNVIPQANTTYYAIWSEEN